MWQFTRGYPNISQPDFGILMKSDYKIVSGWWFFATPLKNDGVRQLGWWHSQLNGKIIQMFQTTNQVYIYIYGYGSIPIDTFLGGWTSIYQLFWGSPGVQGFDPSPCIYTMLWPAWALSSHSWRLLLTWRQSPKEPPEHQKICRSVA